MSKAVKLEDLEIIKAYIDENSGGGDSSFPLEINSIISVSGSMSVGSSIALPPLVSGFWNRAFTPDDVGKRVTFHNAFNEKVFVVTVTMNSVPASDVSIPYGTIVSVQCLSGLYVGTTTMALATVTGVVGNTVTAPAGHKLAIGDLLYSIADRIVKQIISISGTGPTAIYTLQAFGLNLVQTTGTSTGLVMSQKAVTDALNEKIPTAYILEKFYPVGAIYLTTDVASPATLFGGTWTRISSNVYLKANSGGIATAGTTGGTSSGHKIPLSALPSHGRHLYQYDEWGGKGTLTNANQKIGWFLATNSDMSNYGTNPRGWDVSAGNEAYPAGQNVGGGSAYLPYYYSVNVWRRTA